jgi:hypothetical protein
VTDCPKKITFAGNPRARRSRRAGLLCQLPLLSATGCGKNVALIANQAEKRRFVDHCGRAFL